MNIEGRIFNIDQELNRLYKLRDILMVQMERKPELHKIYVRYSSIMTEIREQLKLRRECENEAGNRRLRDWLKAEHPGIYKKFFDSEGKEEIKK